MSWNLDDYEPVDVRLDKFWSQHPTGRVNTELIHHDDTRFIVRAEVWRDAATTSPDATGFAEEIVGATPVNRSSALENCETSAIGRALANLGYASKGARPSREEMAKVAGREPKPKGETSDKACPACSNPLEDLRATFEPGGKTPAWRCVNKTCTGGGKKKSGGNWPWASWNPHEFDDSAHARWAKNVLWGLIQQNRSAAVMASAVPPDIDDVALGRAFWLEMLAVSGQVEPLSEEAAKAVVDAAEKVAGRLEEDPERVF